MSEQYYKVKSEAIRELIRKYQIDRSHVIFALILKRVDELIFTVLFEMIKTDKYLLHVELEDLYHTAIIGLHDGIMSFSEEVDYKYTIARIIAYIKCCIRREFRYLRKHICNEILAETFLNSNKVDTPNIEKTVNYILTLETWCKDLFNRKVFDSKDLQIIKLRFVEEKTYKEIGEAVGYSTNYSHVRTKRIISELCKIKRYS